MDFPNPPPPPPFMPPPFPGGRVGGFWSQNPMNNENGDQDSNSQFDSAPPLKRSKSSGNNPHSDSLPPLNPRMIALNPQVNKGTGYIFYKTRMCLKFQSGKCQNGEHCNFAHGPDDLREPPPNWQEIVASREKDKGPGNWNDDQRVIHRMKICKKYYNGEECPYGDNCNFLHKDRSSFKSETVEPRESSAIKIGTTGPMWGHKPGSDQYEDNENATPNLDPVRHTTRATYWKTKICSQWGITGQCHFGERCHFAHGQSDIQVPGGLIEAEVLNASTVSRKPVAPGNVAGPASLTVISASTREEGEGKKNLLSKWKGPRKTNGIYADWIDDLMPPQGPRRT